MLMPQWGVFTNYTGVEMCLFLSHAEWQEKAFDMARSGQSLCHLLWTHKDKGSLAELSQCTASQAVNEHYCYPCLFFTSQAFFQMLIQKSPAEDKNGAVSLPSIWCCMPLSGCQPAHSNEGCHQGYSRLECCLFFLLSSVSPHPYILWQILYVSLSVMHSQSGLTVTFQWVPISSWDILLVVQLLTVKCMFT